ncbi:HesB/YadR/YfhF family protein [Halobacillus seohaensis]|uniref:HesB/YadR/YfhF family protein n=1 Tax=Halobacillus seohaensis TaxID=447421 RepID=A0ABW2EFQ4_9BACI
MNLKVTEQAAQWYESEIDINNETSIRFFVRYGGSGGLQPGLSLAIQEDKAREPIAEDKVNKVTYFIEADDEWYFDGRSLTVQLNEKWQEPEFIYD